MTALMIRAPARLTTIVCTFSARRSHGTAERQVKHARFLSGSIDSVSRLAGGRCIAPSTVTATLKYDSGTVKEIGPSGSTPTIWTCSPGCR